MLGAGVVIQAALLVFGIVWCREAILRFPSEVSEFRQPPHDGARFSIAFWWAVTAVVMVLVGMALVGIVMRIGSWA